jgi:16S rRNA (adenine1518-N6/adenine1519-N6)-dimethyltransferase
MRGYVDEGEQIRPKKSLGQHFLKDPYYLKKIAEIARIGPDDQVLEIGPGLGHLTRELAAKAKMVIAIEFDKQLIPRLREEFSETAKIEIVHADALEYQYDTLPGTWKVVANLPYYISSPIVRKLLQFRDKFTTLSLMLQKEVAERIASPPGSKEYGFLSVLVQFYTEPKIEFMVPAGAFTPAPEVDSAVITLTILKNSPRQVKNEDFLMRVVKAAFSQRRNTLRNALKQLDVPRERMEKVLASTGIDLGRRAETLSIDDFGKLADFLYGQHAEKANKKSKT